MFQKLKAWASEPKDWPVITARIVTVAGLFTATGALHAIVPVAYQKDVAAVALIIVSQLPSVMKASGLVRPVVIDSKEQDREISHGAGGSPE